MRVIVFGATGMVGQGVVRECLLDEGVTEVLSIARRASGQTHPKLKELTLPDLTDYGAVADQLAGYDACFFCLGVTSAGMKEDEYRRITKDIAVAVAKVLVEKSPNLTFIFVSGRGTDSTGTSKVMWARVKGEAENAIFAMPFKAKYAFRPAVIRPRHGIRSRTPAYNFLYFVCWPLFPIIGLLFPRSVTTTERVGRAMLNVTRYGAKQRILESHEIDAAADPPSS